MRIMISWEEDYLDGSDHEDSACLIFDMEGWEYPVLRWEEPRIHFFSSAEVSSSTTLSTELGLSSVEWSVDD